jgi:hypothetical protein
MALFQTVTTPSLNHLTPLGYEQPLGLYVFLSYSFP